MKGLREYELSFSGLKNGKHQFEFPLDQKFFERFDTEVDFENYQGLATVYLEKHNNFMEADIDTQGTVTLLCDYTAEPYTEKVSNRFPLIIKFGDHFNNEDDEVLILPHEAYQFNVAQYIYENVLLSIPLKRVCKQCAALEEEQESNPSFSEKAAEENTSDPRWDALKKLKNK